MSTQQDSVVVVVKEPNKKAVRRTIQPTHEAVQKIVGGYLQAIPVADGLTMCVDDDGQGKGLPENLLHSSGPPIVGTVVVCKRTRRGQVLTLSKDETAKTIRMLTWLAL